MNQKNIAIAAVLAAALLAGIFSTTTPMAAYAEDDYDDDEHEDDERDYDRDHDDNDRNGRDYDHDDSGRDRDKDGYKGGGDESKTNTEQKLAQKNVGSGESTNFNCGENSIDSGLIDAQLCGTVDLGVLGGIMR
jgi:hypothetical protein